MSSRHRAPDRPAMRQVFRHPTFRVLYAAESQSIVGDQLARVALAVLVFNLTDSVAATALTYAATFVPAIVGSVVLTGVADRFSRRRSMIVTDLVRAGLFAVMAMPGLPLVATVALVVVAVAVGPVFTASEVGRLSTDLSGEQFRAATGLRLITNQAAQVGGFLIGGALVAWLEPGGALVVNAATFLASATLIAVRLPPDPHPVISTATADADDPALRLGRRHIFWADRRLRGLLATCWLAGFYVVPEGLAVPLAGEMGATTVQAGVLLASIPLGGAVGACVLVRWVPVASRERTAIWMAVLAGVPLVITLAEPPWPVIVGVWAVSGGLAAYQIEVMTLIVQCLPEVGRVGLLGIVGAGLIAVQGLGVVMFGVVAQFTGSAVAVACAGVCGTSVAAFVGRGLRAPSGAGVRESEETRHAP